MNKDIESAHKDAYHNHDNKRLVLPPSLFGISIPLTAGGK